MTALSYRAGRPVCVGVDSRPLSYPPAGNSRYLHQMLKHLLKELPDFKWVLFMNRPLHTAYSDLRQAKNVHIDFHRSGYLLGPAWLHARVVPRLRHHECGLFWATLALLPILYKTRTQIPCVVNYHDLNAFVVPRTMVWWNCLQHRLLAGASLRNASRILCLSHTTKADIQRFFPQIDPRKLDVIYPGCELPKSRSHPPSGDIAGLPPFILCVGTLEPRKNHKTLLRAYRAAKQHVPDLRPLVVAGRKGWGNAKQTYGLLRSGCLESSGVFFVENAPTEGLRWLYENAAYVVLPSLHEGFGLPAIEAMQFRKPTILSDIPIFREVGGDSLFADPNDSEKWCDALIEADRLFRERKLRHQDVSVPDWSWSTRAKALAGIIEETLR